MGDPIQKRAFITGGGSGIGLATAKLFLENNVDVVVAGRNTQRLAETGLDYIAMDVEDEQSVADAVKKAGRIDIFINNAGAASTAPALKTSRAMWDSMLSVNLTGAFHCARAALPQMVDRGWGRFIVIASTASFKAYPYTAAYTAAKHGVLGLVRSLAVELAKSGVTANAVCPGFTDTDLVAGSIEAIVHKTGKSQTEAASALVRHNPQARLIRPEEVASAALWLSSEANASVNGQTVVIDGGEAVS